MPLTIFGYEIEKLSGPTNFALIVPTDTLLHTLGVSYVPVIMLMGDLHDDIDITLSCQDSKDELATYVPFWFRLLDAMASQECPIDYFIESFFHPKLLNAINNPEGIPYYLNDKRKYFLFNDSDISPMNIMQNFYVNCFSTTTYGKSNCITSNIRYHFTDVRLDVTYQNVSDDDRETLYIMRHLLHKNLPSRDIFVEAQKYSQPTKRVYSEYFLPTMYRDKAQDFDTDEPIPTNHHATFENEYVFMLEAVLNQDFITFRACTHEFYGTEILKVLHMALTQPEAFIKYIVSIPQFMSHSMLGKQMITNRGELHVIDVKLVHILVEYYEFCYTHIIQKNNYYTKVVKVLQILRDNYSTFIILYTRKMKKKDKKDESIREQIRDLEEEINDLCTNANHLITDLTIPFMDMYFLFRSWKQTSIPCLSIYNAGAIHTASLWKFLIAKYYIPIVGTGKHMDGQNQIDTMLKHHKTPQSKPTISKVKVKRERCLLITPQVNLIDLISKNLQAAPNALLAFTNKGTLMNTRLSVLGPDLLRSVLDGYPLSHQVIESKLSEYEHKHGFRPDIQMSPISLPDEYLTHRTLQ